MERDQRRLESEPRNDQHEAGQGARLRGAGFQERRKSEVRVAGIDQRYAHHRHCRAESPEHEIFVGRLKAGLGAPYTGQRVKRQAQEFKRYESGENITRRQQRHKPQRGHEKKEIIFAGAVLPRGRPGQRKRYDKRQHGKSKSPQVG